MTFAGRGDGSLQSGRTSTSNHHFLGLGSDRQMIVNTPFVFATSARVLNTTQPTVESHAANTFLIAAQAQTNFVGGTGTSLDCKVGVGDLSTHNSDEVALTFGECTLGLQRIFETANADNRKINCFTNCGRNEHCVSRRNMHAGFNHEQAGSCNTN